MGIIIGLFALLFISVLATRLWFIVLPIIIIFHFCLIEKPDKDSPEKEPFLVRYKKQATIPVFIGGIVVCVAAIALIPIFESHEAEGSLWWYCIMFSVGVIAIICSANPKSKSEAEPKQEELQNAESPIELNNNDDTENWPKPFGKWTKKQLSISGQASRYARSIEDYMQIIYIDKSAGTAEIMGTQGTVYDVTLNKCNCPDFEHRHLPCKHIYLLARNIKKSKGGLK